MTPKYELLGAKTEIIEDHDMGELGSWVNHVQRRGEKRNRLVGIAVLVLSLLLNAGLLFRLRNAENTCHSKFSGLGYDTPMTYEGDGGPWTTNETVIDALWDGISTDPIAVALDDSYAVSKGLPIADRFPWDDSKGVYYLKVYHDLHCLKLMRRFAKDALEGKESGFTWMHYEHCANGLRQDIACRGDDTPMPGFPGNARGIGDGQNLQCRDLDKLVEWTQAPERNACFRTVTDLDTVHTLERFAFCPKDSPYYDVQTKYFEKWGHESIP